MAGRSAVDGDGVDFVNSMQSLVAEGLRKPTTQAVAS